MLTSVLLIAQLIACGESEEPAAAPPPPPAPTPAAAPAPKPAPAAEKATDGAAADGAAANGTDATAADGTDATAADGTDATAADGAAADGTDATAADGAAVSMEGTKVASKKEKRKFATGQLKATEKDKLLPMGQQMLVNKSKREGYSLDKSTVKLVGKVKKDGKKWIGIAQGESTRTVYTYAAGNQVTVSQEDKSKKDAIIKSVSGSEYVVTYADGSENTVKKSALQPR